MRGHGHSSLKISDSDFLKVVAGYMADSGKRRRIVEHATTAGQYDWLCCANPASGSLGE
ncbi:MAG: hypothetical protein MZV65_14335 [Chromatiales bacterium]|nr:hypothetical protein [Chromatiales bacterium]